MAPAMLLALGELCSWLSIICCAVGQLFHVEQFGMAETFVLRELFHVERSEHLGRI